LLKKRSNNLDLGIRRLIQVTQWLLWTSKSFQGWNNSCDPTKNLRQLFKKLFHGEMHMDDDNMSTQFQQIPVHSLQEISLHHFHLFLVFLEIHASIDQNVSMARRIMMMETCSKRFNSIQSTIWEIWTKQVDVL